MFTEFSASLRSKQQGGSDETQQSKLERFNKQVNEQMIKGGEPPLSNDKQTVKEILLKNVHYSMPYSLKQVYYYCRRCKLLNKKERETLRKWLNSVNWFNPYGITLTLKQKVNGIPLDNYKCQSVMSNFLGRINRKVFGNNYKRRKQQIQRVVSLETDKRKHYHLILSLPERYGLQETSSMIEQTWNDRVIPYCYKEKKINQLNNTEGWIKYITKFENSADEVDYLNCYLDQS